MTYGTSHKSEDLAGGRARPLLPWRDLSGAFPRRGAAAGPRPVVVPAYLQHLMQDYLLPPGVGPDRARLLAADPAAFWDRHHLPPLPPHVAADAPQRATELALPALPELSSTWLAVSADALPALPVGLAPGAAPQPRQLSRPAKPMAAPAAIANHAQVAAPLRAPDGLRAAAELEPLVAEAEALARRALKLYGPRELANLLRQARSMEEYHYIRALHLDRA